MASTSMRSESGVLGYVRALFRGGAVAGLGDAQLLERYRAGGDAQVAEHAFAALLQRHGPMVLRACRAVARDQADAEDAFQATFLVLARRARSLWVRDSLGPWLHAVAVRTAADARDASDRRRRHERRYAEMAATLAQGEADDDLRALLHEEIARLPHKLQAPVVLCDLEGLTHEQAAGQLGWPLGTLKTRLTSARERLKGRLARRGIGPAAVGLIVHTLAAEAAAGAVPAALVESTLRATVALRLAANVAATGAVAAAVERLVNEVLRSMIVSRIQRALMTLLATGVLLGGAMACRALLASAPTTPKAKAADAPTAQGRPIDVHVVDKQTGRPVVGATVRAVMDESRTGAQPGTTDPTGHHVITYQPESRFLTLHVRADGYVPVRMDWGVRRGGAALVPPAAYTVPLEHAATIGGVVADEAGRPLPGATVFVLVPPRPATEPGVSPRIDIWQEPCPTDAQGRWRFAFVPADPQTPWLRVTHPKFVSKAIIDDQPAVLKTLRNGSHEVRLERGLPLAGRVLDGRGKPIAGAVLDKGPSLSNFLHEQATTDAQGRFRFDAVAAGKTVLTVHAQGHAPALREVDVSAGQPPLEFQLGLPQTVRGRVVDTNGKPVPHAHVVTDSWRGYRTLDIRAEADAEGRFSISDLPNEPVEFQVSKEGYMNRPNQRLTPAAEAEAVVTLTRPLVIRGAVTDAESGKPIERFTLLEGGDPSAGQEHWDRDRPRPFQGGRYEIVATWPYPSVRALRVEAVGYVPAHSRGFRIDEGEVTFDFKLKPGAEPVRPGVTGIILQPDGTPATDAEVSLASQSFVPLFRNGRLASRRRNPVMMTGRNGVFRFEPQTVPVGVVVVHDSGFAAASESELAALPDRAIRLQAWGRIEGVVRIGNSPGAGQEVRLDLRIARLDEQISPYFDEKTRTDAQGRFTFDRVIPGRALVTRVIPTAPGRSTYARWTGVDVPAGGTARVTLGGTGRPVTGRLVGANDGPLPVDPGTIQAYFQLRPPPVTDPKFADRSLTKEQRLAWYKGWIETAEGKAYLAFEKDRRFYGLAVARDGWFRVDDVIPGTYDLTFRIFVPSARPGSPPDAEARQIVTIEPIPGERSDVPLDLGTIELRPQS